MSSTGRRLASFGFFYFIIPSNGYTFDFRQFISLRSIGFILLPVLVLAIDHYTGMNAFRVIRIPSLFGCLGVRFPAFAPETIPRCWQGSSCTAAPPW